MKVEGEDSKEFAVRVGIHQGSALSPFIFALVMDVVTEEVENALMYADNLVLIYETKNVTSALFFTVSQILLIWELTLCMTCIVINRTPGGLDSSRIFYGTRILYIPVPTQVN